MSWHYSWRPYVPVAKRRARAARKVAKLRKKGIHIEPVEIEGRKIVRTFWGEAWCDHLEKFSDFANRLPRGRTYVRNGSVCHLEISEGAINAMVSGSELYNVKVNIKKLARKKWGMVRERCAGQIGSLLELLQGSLSRGVMAVVTDRDNGLFPLPKEISLNCDCPDWAVMCKHVAAVLYGVGARLDERPELLFLLRGVDHEELVSADADAVAAATTADVGGRRRIADADLADVFGIEMASAATSGGKGRRHRGRAVAVEKKASRPGRRQKSAEKTAMPRKKSSCGRGGAGTTTRGPRPASVSKAGSAKRPVHKTSKSKPVTGKTVSRLRAKFGMSQSQFARLLGVSTPTIGNWERTKGQLNLQVRTQRAWSSVKDLSRKGAKRYHQCKRSRRKAGQESAYDSRVSAKAKERRTSQASPS